MTDGRDGGAAGLALRPTLANGRDDRLRAGPGSRDRRLPAAERLAARVRGALAADAPLVVTGCGTSEHAALAVGTLLEDALRLQGRRRGRVSVRQALDAALDPWDGLCLGISHDGASRATVLALEAARRAGATTSLITARADAPATAVADEVCVTPQQDQSWCHTVAYLSPILVGGLLAQALGGPALEALALGAYLEATVALQEPAAALAQALQGRSPLLTCGAESDGGLARELALKVEEGVRVPAVMRHLETLLHGHLAACDQRTGLVILATDPRGGARRTQRVVLAARAAQRVGLRIAAILAPTMAALIPPEVTDAGRLVLPEGGELPPLVASLTGGAVALQVLTVALVRQAGVNPDRIRREEAPYREAAALAEDAATW